MLSFCPTCEDYSETKVSERKETYTVKGCEITIPVKVNICASCGETIGSDEDDQQVINAVNAEYRKQFDLLTSEKIKLIRKRYNLSQKSFSILLGMSEATLNRYEQGSVQEQVHDNLIRACEDPKFLLDLLHRSGNVLTDWQRKRVESAIPPQIENHSSKIDLSNVDWILMPKEISENTGFRCFDYTRFAYTVIFICTAMGKVSKTVLNKLAFYADFLCFKTSTVSLTGAAYRKLDYGPALADYGGLLSRMESEGLLTHQEEYPNGYPGDYYQPGPNAESVTTDFTPNEYKVLNCIIETFRGWTAKKISDKSHEESAWKNTEYKKYISYQEAKNLSLETPSPE